MVTRLKYLSLINKHSNIFYELLIFIDRCVYVYLFIEVFMVLYQYKFDKMVVVEVSPSFLQSMDKITMAGVKYLKYDILNSE